MASPTLDRDIQSRIQSFLAELSGLVRRAALEAVQLALAGGGAPRRRGPRRPAKVGRPARSSRRVRRSTEDLDAIAARVLAHVKAHPGHRLEEIGAGLKTDTAVLKRPVAKLLVAKRIRTEGRKRGTKYFAGGGRGPRKAKAGKSRKRSARAARRSKLGRRATRSASKAATSAAPAAS